MVLNPKENEWEELPPILNRRTILKVTMEADKLMM